MKKLTVNEQEELFAQDCKLINLRYEYSGFTGTEKWAIVTELSEEALWDKYPDIISRYMPFILLSMAQGEVISESHRNNDKYEKRSKRTIDVYGYEDDIFEQFHPKSIAPFIDPFDKAEEEQIEEEKEKLRQLELSKVRKALSMLLYKSSYNPDCYMLCGHVHTTRENDFLNKWRAELKNSRSLNSHNCGNIINVGCMLPYMGYTPRTLARLFSAPSMLDCTRLSFIFTRAGAHSMPRISARAFAISSD